MRDYIKLTRLDILSIGWGWFIFTFVYAFLFNLMFIFWINDFSILCASSQVIAMMIIWSFFGFQERDKFILLYGSLPISTKKIVLGRYISMALIFSIFFVKDVVIYIILSILLNWHLDSTIILQGFLFSLLFFSLVTTIVPPLYKFGLMKSVAWFAIVFFIFLMSFCLLAGIGAIPRFIELWKSHLLLFGGGSILLSCIIIYCSYRTALTAYRTRRWT